MFRLFFLGCMFLICLSANASSITEKRIFLNNDNAINKFRIANYTEFEEVCELKFSHHLYNDDASQAIPLPDTEQPENSAIPWFRFSPRKFTLTTQSEQFITFRFRRVLNTSAAEYRSYLLIDCKSNRELRSDGQLEVSMQPRIIHKVPIIVRTGQLSSNLTFKDVNIRNGKLLFNVFLNGQRSVFGDVRLVNKETETVISDLNNVAIYPESSHRKLSIKLPENINPSSLKLVFIEITKYGGSIVEEFEL